MTHVFGALADFKEGTLRLFTGVTACSNIVNNKTTGASVAITQAYGEGVSAGTNSTDWISSVGGPTEKHFTLLHTDRFA
jgi:hypothetical protein